MKGYFFKKKENWIKLSIIKIWVGPKLFNLTNLLKQEMNELEYWKIESNAITSQYSWNKPSELDQRNCSKWFIKSILCLKNIKNHII